MQVGSTPTRRSAPGEIGQSPAAKRVRSPQEAAVAGGAEMNATQLSQAIYQLQVQAQLEHQWMKVAEEAVTQHAECIDASRIAAS